LFEPPRIRHRRTATEDCTRRLDVGSGIEQRVEHLDVAAACRPMQRRFLMRSAEAGVDVGSGVDQGGDGCRAVGVVARPIGDDMEQGSRYPLPIIVPEPSRRQPAILDQ